ncbi:MAG: sulfatase-like hydrolase/transferase, partial [Chlorobi bacterium]|nr:sulfatase-like hydrolase/transferase [Chlorobiota bacterium]
MKKPIFFLMFFFLLNSVISYGQARPNILWITCEDISPYLGCYGDSLAVTPNLDRLATRGIRYTHAFANTAVCAPARSTIIMGMYASTLGTENMRSRYKVPDAFKPYPVYLREAGYYCTNHTKTDYNTSSFNREIWDDCSRTATYKNRKPGQPFFAIYNLTISHEHIVF